jgi:hypothetical protein
MTPHHLAPNGRMHLRYGLRLALAPQAAGYLIETGFREAASGTQQNSIAGFFDSEFGTRRPGSGGADVLGGRMIWPFVERRVFSMVRLQ